MWGSSPQMLKSVTTGNVQSNTETEKIAENGNENVQEKVQKRTVNIKDFNEDELMKMLRSYMDRKAAFANNTKNFHKELKECTANTRTVLYRYVSISSKDKTTPSPETTSLENIKTDFLAEIKDRKVIIGKQNETTSKLTV